MHHAETVLRIRVALRCSKPKQPPCLGKVFRPAFAAVVHEAESALRLGVALRLLAPTGTVDVAGLREAGLTGPALGRALDDKRIKRIKEYKKEFLEKWQPPSL